MSAKKFEVRLMCKVCGHRYRRRLLSESDPDPACPACGKREKVRGMDYSSNRAPANVGQNIQVRAIDETAKVTMEMYQMTDLRTDVRPGESAAPKIAPALQAQADGFFGGGKGRNKLPVNPAILKRAALQGAFNRGTPDVVGAVHAARKTIPVEYIAGDGIKGGSR